MNTLSIGSRYLVSPLLSPTQPGKTTRPALDRPGYTSPRPQRPARQVAAGRFSLADDRVSSGLSLGLIGLTLTAVGYAFLQLWHLVGGETLNHAVRAFAP